MPFGDKKKQVEFMRQWRQARQQEIRDYKEANPCTDCGMFLPYYCMDFDHLGDKVMNVSRMQGYSWERVLREIAKCELVCAVCHRKRTHLRSGSQME